MRLGEGRKGALGAPLSPLLKTTPRRCGTPLPSDTPPRSGEQSNPPCVERGGGEWQRDPLPAVSLARPAVGCGGRHSRRAGHTPPAFERRRRPVAAAGSARRRGTHSVHAKGARQTGQRPSVGEPSVCAGGVDCQMPHAVAVSGCSPPAQRARCGGAGAGGGWTVCHDWGSFTTDGRRDLDSLPVVWLW